MTNGGEGQVFRTMMWHFNGKLGWNITKLKRKKNGVCIGIMVTNTICAYKYSRVSMDWKYAFVMLIWYSQACIAWLSFWSLMLRVYEDEIWCEITKSCWQGGLLTWFKVKVSIQPLLEGVLWTK